MLLFVDNSNIFISAKDEAFRREGRQAKDQVRLQFDQLLQLALAGRPLAHAFVVGSIPPEQRAVWERLEAATGVKPELYERGQFSGGEQGLDQCLQVHMLRAISDHPDPQVAVLMTGDGAGYDDGVGFHADMERMNAAGWGIEVLSWQKPCRRALREWATANGVFVALDDHYESVTFLEGGRRSKALDLSRRVVSAPRASLAQRAAMAAKTESEAKVVALQQELEALKTKASAKAKGKAKYERRMARNQTTANTAMEPSAPALTRERRGSSRNVRPSTQGLKCQLSEFTPRKPAISEQTVPTRQYTSWGKSPSHLERWSSISRARSGYSWPGRTTPCVG